MTRREQIKSWARLNCPPEVDTYRRKLLELQYVAGAEKADENPIVTDIYRSLDRAHHAEEKMDAMRLDYGYAQDKLERKLAIAIEALKEKESMEPGPRGYENIAAGLALKKIEKLK